MKSLIRIVLIVATLVTFFGCVKKSEVAELKSKLTTTEREQERTHDAIAHLQGDIEALVTELRVQARKVSDAESEISEIKSDLDRNRDAYSSLQGVSDKIIEIESKVSDLEMDLELKEDALHHIGDVDSLREQVDKIETNLKWDRLKQR